MVACGHQTIRLGGFHASRLVVDLCLPPYLLSFVAKNDDESEVRAWGPNLYPPSGFMSFMNSTASPRGLVSNGSKLQAINLADDEDDGKCGRTEKRMLWTKKEDLRLVSAWLKSSNDPIQIQLQENDQYWKVWKEANALWASGESDADIEAKAMKSYEEENKKDGPFTFKHCWEVLRKEPKWEAYLERLEDLEPDKRKFCEEDDVGKCFSLDDDADERPIGGKQAKEQRKKKKKGQPCIIDLEDELNSFLDAQKTTNEGRKEMLETQRRVSSENLEARKLAHLKKKSTRSRSC
ncbi:unnamed protein product [Miscanthus lutarioriparius]|uniref:No apical meristem-associated C-terminal domain-containing protein n=1 Tax=Miscanthus lutarioriparius TaxID=422564 RepID=A0A811R8G1_9POAL|nr:unnamed protein product [Miscanthus lutarioriparius]